MAVLLLDWNAVRYPERSSIRGWACLSNGVRGVERCTCSGRIAAMSAGRDEEIPEPPWRAARSDRPARTPLSRDAIVDAALRVLEREGSGGLSMRRIADELGTGAATLYWHVTSKDGLIDLILDRVGDEIGVPEPDPSRWQEQLVQWVVDSRAVYQRHPGVGALTLGRIPVGPNMVRWVEWILALLRGVGIPDRIAAYAGDLLGLYLGAQALEDSMGPQSPTGEPLQTDELVGMMRGYFESLPEDRFPNIHGTLDELFAGDADGRFRLGLEIIVRGLASYAEPPPPA
jgi:AcrR family transcriptional regulator